MKAVMVPAPTHERLRTLSDETGMAMKFWADFSIRFFLGHVSSERIIEAAKGMTMAQWDARETATHDSLETLLSETTPAGPHGTKARIERPLLPNGYEAAKPRPAEAPRRTSEPRAELPAPAARAHH
jgi:hypothetical protein